MSNELICPICRKDWSEGDCPHSIDEIVANFYSQLEIAQKQLKIARHTLNEASSILKGYSQREWHETDLAGNEVEKIKNVLAEIDKIK
jgi:hypothetical protein